MKISSELLSYCPRTNVLVIPSTLEVLRGFLLFIYFLKPIPRILFFNHRNCRVFDIRRIINFSHTLAIILVVFTVGIALELHFTFFMFLYILWKLNSIKKYFKNRNALEIQEMRWFEGSGRHTLRMHSCPEG